MKFIRFVLLIMIFFVFNSTHMAVSAEKEDDKLLQYFFEQKEHEKLSAEKRDVDKPGKQLVEQREHKLQQALEDEFRTNMHEKMHKLYVEAPEHSIIVSEGTGEPSFYSEAKNGFKSRLMVIWRLVDDLNLNEDTSTKFFPVYLNYLDSRDKLMKEHRELIREIAEKADDESVSVKDLKEKIAKLKNVEKSLHEKRDAFLEKSKTILDERQYIKLMVFEDKLKADLFSRYRRMRSLSGKTDDSHYSKPEKEEEDK